MNKTFHILLIDDHPTQTSAYRGIFELAEASTPFEFHEIHSLKAAYEFAKQNHLAKTIDFIILDLSLPACAEYNLYSGEDVAKVFRNEIPQAQICFITSHHEAFVLYDLYQEFHPTGILVKSDFDGMQLEKHFSNILNGIQVYSPTFLAAKNKINESEIFLDRVNRQIISKLADGYPSKDLPDLLGRSMSSIDKRKSNLKIFFNTERQKDNYLILQAKKMGFI